MKGRPVDQKARDRALEPKVSFHIEAPAGSGKTSVLLARYLRLLGTVEDPGQILALTFTRKAAGELRSRVVQTLLARTDPDPAAPPVQHLLSDLAEKAFWHLDRLGLSPAEALMPERLQILTFHTLCSRLLSLAPVEAGVPLGFTLIEDAELELVKEEALEELRHRLSRRPPGDAVRQALERRLVRLNNEWPRLAGELGELISRRDCLGDFLRLARLSQNPEAYREMSLARLGQILAPDLEALAAAWSATGLAREWGGFLAYLHQQGAPLAATLPAQAPGGTLADLPAWRQLAQAFLTQKGILRKSLTTAEGYPSGFNKTPWAGRIKALPPEVVELLGRFRDVPPPVILPEEVAALQDLVILVGEALGVYEEVCRRRRALDYIALEEAALRLLGREAPSELLLRLDCRFRHLLVDEFQDTSLNQMRLLCRLLEGWETGDGRTLTVVGDPKQSIYGWRDAKVELFLQAREGLRCQGSPPFFLESLFLETNFRSSQTLISWVNEFFGPTVFHPDLGRQVPFHASRPAPGAGAGEAPSLTLFWQRDKTAAREAEARWLAAQVAALSSGGGSGERVGILLFARTHLAVYLAALQEAGQAVRVREGLRLADSPAVQHLHNLARALSHPHDHLAWAGVLTGPWAGQGLAGVADAARLPGELWPQRLEAWLTHPHCPPELAPVLEGLLRAYGDAGRRPLEEVLRDFLDQTGSWASIAAREGALGVANARNYLDLVAQAESGGAAATYRKTGVLLAQAYQPPDPRAQDSPVEIMTVHGAKGLEFDRVVVPYLDWSPLNRNEILPYLLEEIPGTGLYALALAPPYWRPEKSLLYQRLSRLRQERVLAEARRVFYVAVTRARARLSLSAVLGQNTPGRETFPSESPLGWLWRHYRPETLKVGQDRWGPPELKVEVHEDWPAVTGLLTPAAALPPAWRCPPEAIPYRLTTVTSLKAADPDPPGAAPPAAGDPQAGARGEIIHRLLEVGLAGEPLPDVPQVAAALRSRGLTPAEAAALAPEVRAEAQACLEDPFLTRLAGARESRREWLLEDAPARELVRRGRPDLVAREGEVWWLVDFKSSRPPAGVAWEEFLARELERYQPQLNAYREMVAARLGLSPASLRTALYFTACRRLVEVS